MSREEIKKQLILIKREHEKNSPAGVYLRGAHLLFEIFLPEGGSYFEVII